MTNNEAANQLSDILLQSLYDYHFAIDGAGYRLAIMMLEAVKIVKWRSKA